MTDHAPVKRDRRGLYRAFATVGGALGALPLVAPARTLATRLFPIPELSGAERLTLDVKQATYFETAVLLTLVPAAAIFFGRILPAILEKRRVPTARAYLPGVGFASALAIWRAGGPAKVALGFGLAVAAAIVFGPWLRRRLRVLAPLALVVIFVAGVIGFYRPAKRLDLFEDGLILFGAHAFANGSRPYLDVYPVHGWGADGGLNGIFFRWADHDLESFHVVRAVTTALALAALAAACFLFFRDPGWGAVAFAACLAFCTYPSERHVPSLIAFCLLINAARSGKTRDWAWAGALSAASLFVTLDFGLILFLAGAVGPFLLAVLERRSLRTEVRSAIGFGAGFVAGSLPFSLILAARGAFVEFLRVSFLEIPRVIVPAWNFPAGSFTQALREGTLIECLNPFGPWFAPSLCVLFLVLIAAVVLLCFRWADRVVEPVDRAAAISVLVSAIALRGVLGRADLGHRMIYGVFAGLPAAWLLFRAWQMASRFRPLVFALTAAAFFLFLRPDRALTRELNSITASGYVRSHDASQSTRVAGYGSAMLARDQAADLEKLRRFVDENVPPGKTFFDFGNEPALYFLLNRRAPVRYSCVPSYQTVEKQREVIAALERERPPLAILSSGTPADTFDSVPNRDRAPLVARFLDARYRVVGKVGPRTLGAWAGP